MVQSIKRIFNNSGIKPLLLKILKYNESCYVDAKCSLINITDFRLKFQMDILSVNDKYKKNYYVSFFNNNKKYLHNYIYIYEIIFKCINYGSLDFYTVQDMINENNIDIDTMNSFIEKTRDIVNAYIYNILSDYKSYDNNLYMEIFKTIYFQLSKLIKK